MPTDPNIREQIEPGIMGNTDPVEQKLLENLSHLAAGYSLAKMGGSAAEAIYQKIASKLSSANNAANSMDAIHQLAGLTPEESTVAKSLADKAIEVNDKNPDHFAPILRQKWGLAAQEQSGTSFEARGHYIDPQNFLPHDAFAPAAILGTAGSLNAKLGQINPQNQSELQSLRDRLLNSES